MSTPDPEPPTPSDESVSAGAEPHCGLAIGKVALLVGVAVLGYGLDQLTKAWAVSSLEIGVPQDLIGSVLRLRRTSNSGAAFSIATNATWVLTIVACCVIVATIYMARKLRSRAWACALGLLIGGALGNLTDRFFREPKGGQGHVVDFLELPNWPIFNVADMCIVSAAVLICILAFMGIGVDGTRAADDDESDADESDDGESGEAPATDSAPSTGKGSTRL